ncbi:M28 family peptidase [Shewanella sp. JM162201]|uniref:M28 family peptidase n=1 Tax=Shewanella jiangmenensis TaxID=2837387 RepID=A0ABS5V5P0_9GAMM|nr:M28 family metallopeptidase [Shewanella jiangmenensis]MBT1445779.1 M28 family peptidase [Shewanella jiangmenensis]
MKPLLPLGMLLLTACSQGSAVSQPPAPDFNEARYRNDIKILSSDDFEGRAPTTRGEQLTLDYLSTAFKAAGLKGANNGSFLQSVPMVTYTAAEDQRIRLGKQNPSYRKDIVLSSHHNNAGIDIKNAPLVFVGYGIRAPEYQWDDYAGLDMKGKIAVILVNDPGFALPESGKFKGKAMTYYGRWNYKFEEASRQGALGAIIIHDTAPASYPWSVVENSWTGPQQELANLPDSKDRIQVEGWMQLATAKALFADAGLDLISLSKTAAERSGHTALNQSADIAFANEAKFSDSHNLVATLPGTDKADEHILFTAHWDHIGKDNSRDGDKIYNGALDNASGVAGILEIARQFAALDAVGIKNRRSLTFIATTGEEQGLLGSRYYAANPLYPIDNTIAVLNLDSTNVNGRTKDFTIVGKGQSQLEDYFIDAAKKQGREAVSEKNPASGGFFRSDHFSFAKLGVPAAFAGGGSEPIDAATAAYKADMQAKMKGCYHNVCDEYRADWDLSGALEDMAVFFDVAHALANSDARPGYLQQSEFHSLRPAN